MAAARSMLILLALVSVALQVSHAALTSGSIVWRNGAAVFIPRVDKSAVAWGTFEDKMNTTGWAEFSAESSGAYSDWLQSYALGQLEAYMSFDRVGQMLNSVRALSANAPAALPFIRKHDAAVRKTLRNWGMFSGIADVQNEINFMTTAANAPNVLPDSAEEALTPVGRKKIQWVQASLFLAQLDGLRDAFNAIARRIKYEDSMSLEDSWVLQYDGDADDVSRAMQAQQHDAAESAHDSNNAETVAKFIEFSAKSGHCSAMIKLAADDLLFGHASFEDYSEMIRSFKHLRTHFSTVTRAQQLLAADIREFADPSIMDVHTSAHATEWKRLSPQATGAPHVSNEQFISFSSYPGMLISTDDFYMLTSTGLSVFETTLTVAVESDLKETVRADGGVLLGWMRSAIANRLARTPVQWANWIVQSASGTMNSQWFVIDHNRVRQAQRHNKGSATLKLLPGTVVMVEQLPKFTIAEDISAELNRVGHIASFNLPRTPQATDAMFGPNKSSRLRSSDEMSYTRSPRAKIFARDAPNVHSVEDLKRLLRSNDYVNDPLSKGCPGSAIAARYDLPMMEGAKCSVDEPSAYGATDAKVSSTKMSQHVSAFVVGGPTRGTSATQTLLPPFQWSVWQNEHPVADDSESADQSNSEPSQQGNSFVQNSAEQEPIAMLEANTDDEEIEYASVTMKRSKTAHVMRARAKKSKPVSAESASNQVMENGMIDIQDFDWIVMRPRVF